MACIIIRRCVVFIQEIGLGLGLGLGLVDIFTLHVGVLLYAVVYNYCTTTFHEIFLNERRATRQGSEDARLPYGTPFVSKNFVI